MSHHGMEDIKTQPTTVFPPPAIETKKETKMFNSGTVEGASRGDNGSILLQIKTNEGTMTEISVPSSESKKYPIGTQVTMGLRRVRKPRDPNAPKKEKKNGETKKGSSK